MTSKRLSPGGNYSATYTKNKNIRVPHRPIQLSRGPHSAPNNGNGTPGDGTANRSRTPPRRCKTSEMTSTETLHTRAHNTKPEGKFSGVAKSIRRANPSLYRVRRQSCCPPPGLPFVVAAAAAVVDASGAPLCRPLRDGRATPEREDRPARSNSRSPHDRPAKPRESRRRPSVRRPEDPRQRNYRTRSVSKPTGRLTTSTPNAPQQ